MSLSHLASGSHTRGVKKDSTKHTCRRSPRVASPRRTIWRRRKPCAAFNHNNEYCDEFDHLDYLLVMSEPRYRRYNICAHHNSHLDMICAHCNPHLNPAVSASHSQPMVESLPNGDEKHSCLLNCVNYIAKTKGNCSEFSCPTPPPAPGKGLVYP
jgi:hypothetical protein